ncbi:MAG: TonB family protein [Bacteroidota bacterium]
MMTYLLQVSTCWIVFYGIYLLFLRKETFFAINRYYLLGALISGLAIPYLGELLPANHTSTEVYQVMNQITTTVEVSTLTEDKPSIFTWSNFLTLIYLLGVILVFSRFIYGLSRIYAIYRDAVKIKKDKYTLVKSDKYHLPFSFFHFIFISTTLPLNRDMDKILKHEELHANQWHSLDIIITELLQIFFWFNPILIFYKSALKQSHEFLADAYVTKDHNRNSYGQLLLRQSTSGLEIALANHFFHSQIKQRITMMYKEKSKRPAMVKYLAAIPVLIAMLFIFSSNTSDDHIDNLTENDCMNLVITEKGEMVLEHLEVSLKTLSSRFEKATKKCVHIDIANSIDSDVLLPILKAAEEHNIEAKVVHEMQEPRLQMIKKLSKSPTIEQNQWVENTQNNDPIFKVVEEMPRFPGCETMSVSVREKDDCAKSKMLEYIYNNLKYPTTAKIHSVEGIAVIQFVVERDGSISNGTILRDIGEGCGEEALRVINNMPKWIPGKQKGKEVSVKFTLPIRFNLTNDNPSDGLNSTVTDESATGESSNKAKIKNTSNVESDAIFKVVEEMPRFPGCETDDMSSDKKEECAKGNLLNFIYGNLKYPKEAKENGVEGMVIIQMIIEKDGTVSSTQILREPGFGTGIEAKRVIDMMPKWIPGKQKGQNVRVQYLIPIKYKLEGGLITTSKNKRGYAATLLREDFVETKNLQDLLQKLDLFKDCHSSSYTRMVHIRKGVDASVSPVKRTETFSEEALKFVRQAKSGDKYFLEEFKCQCPGDDVPKDYNALTINIKYSNDKKEHVSKEVDRIPLFPGTKSKDESTKQLLNFVFSNVTYPKDAAQNNIEGTTIVKFIVDENGFIQKAKLGKSLGWGIDEEVLELMDKMKSMDDSWTPALVKDEPVAYEYILPIKFKLQDDQIQEAESRELEVQQMSIRPNPSNGNFTLIFDLKDKTPADIIFYSVTGQTLRSLKGVDIPFNQTIDLTEFKNQTIFMNIVQKDKVYTDKIFLN